LRVFFVILVLLLPRGALAGKTVGVLVTGEYLRGPTSEQATRWLQGHDQTAVNGALPADAIKTLADCFVLDDPKCARSVIDARATTDSLISIRVEVTSKKAREIRLTIDWFVKGHNPVSARRTCESCTESVLRSTIDAMLADLAKTVPGQMGRLKVTSTPAGLMVLLDGATIGVTPIERDVTLGQHRVRLVRDGHMSAEKSIVVGASAVTEIALEPPVATSIRDQAPPSAPPPHRSLVVPGILIGLGIGGMAVGAGMYVIGGPTGDNATYTDLRTPGIYVAGGGAALALTGVIYILATRNSSAPTVAVMPGGGAAVGWAGRF
jgi:hypothetical protein